MSERTRRVCAWGSALLVVATSGSAWAAGLTPQDAVAEAAAHSPGLRAAALELAGARALAEGEAARTDPTLTVALSGTHTSSPSLAPGGAIVTGTSDVAEAQAQVSKTFDWGTLVYAMVDTTMSKTSSLVLLGSQQGGAQSTVVALGPGYLLTGKVGVTQPLLRGAGRDVILAPYYKAEAQRTEAARERERTGSALVRDVLVAYWELWYSERALEVDRQARDTARAERDTAAARESTGSISVADVLAFETQLSSKEETVLGTEVDQRARAAELTRLLGRGSGGEDVSLAQAEPPTPAEATDDEVTRALERSPDVRAKAAALVVAGVEERTAADAYRSRLDVDAYAQSQGLGNADIPSAFSQLAGLGAVSAHVGLTLELPLTDTRRARTAEKARDETEAARSNLEAARQSVTSEVTTDVQKMRLARIRIRLASEGIHLAERQLAAEQERFRSGSGTALQVIQAGDTVQAAKKRLARAEVDLVQAHVALAYLDGRLLAEAFR